MDTKDHARKQAFGRLQTRHYQHFIPNQRANTAFFDSSFNRTAKMPITTTFFPALLQACDEEPNETLDIQLTCGICHEQMKFEDEAGPHLRAFVLPCMHIYCCPAPSEKGHLLHRDGDKSIALIEDILKLLNNRWRCFNCDLETFAARWLDLLLKTSQDCTEIVGNGQVLKIAFEYQGKTWGAISQEVDSRLIKQEPLPLHLEIPIKMIEEGLLKAHGLAVPEDGSTLFKYELHLSEMRDRQFLAWERHTVEQTEQEMQECWVGSRQLMVLDLAFDLRDYWSDGNVRRRINARVNRTRENILKNMQDGEVAGNGELPDVYIV
ncbi:hypothetical protein F52700_9305 [Fusarium sp. NRRL 52700]|nr:hypothetical protein F52700_9305 [Fusarium sp. NRRL 52700]